jgi:hypothetical protein
MEITWVRQVMVILIVKQMDVMKQKIDKYKKTTPSYGLLQETQYSYR